MPDLDNHMDELFQKAAENYPLKTTPGNFDDLLPFLSGQPAATGKKDSSKTKRKILAVLLAFLFIGGSTITYFIYDKENYPKVNTATVTTLQKNNPAKTNTESQNNNSLKINNEGPVAQTINILSPGEIKRNTDTKFSAGVIGSIATQEENETPDNNASFNKSGSVYSDKQQVKISVTGPDTENLQGPATESISKTEPKKETIKTAGSVKSNDPGKKKTNVPFFYYGITTGIELNQVKNQGMTKPGLNGGIVLGLQFNKKLAVETGIQLTQKKYYSGGEYFHPKKEDMPANMKVMSLTGNSTLIEVPVSVKYNFSKKKNGVYAKAGVSTYLITRESNKYKAIVSGLPQDINNTYDKVKCYPLAELNLSAGYEHKLAKKINIRVEPYIQIPLKGIGIGSLPVMSTGVHLVLTRN